MQRLRDLIHKTWAKQAHLVALDSCYCQGYQDKNAHKMDRNKPSKYENLGKTITSSQ